ncbi:tetratricopeptide repeat-containing sensor histidine kinase [Flavobacterium sp. N1994]|uniref:tetratricopeptide repeat-containing sensor histidine kinase n=1 Tax=Flavobacterium sp. N1994 TaxID=2986827 RepID=UPI002222583D|nr:tetratricopeptide repeat-containing sensor histidine kinase [Flavobacterium sp. N1994]
MIKKLLPTSFLLFIIFYSCTPKTQTTASDSKNDSIKKYIDLASNDTLPFADRIKYNDKAYSIIDLNKNDSIIKNQLSKIVCVYLTNLSLNKSKAVTNIYFKKSKITNDTLGMARCYNYYGGYYIKRGIYDSSYYYYCKSEMLYKRTSEKFSLAKIYFNKGLAQYFQDDYLGAELSEIKALMYFKKTNDYKNIYNSLNSLGNIFHNMRKYDDAIIYFNEALKISKNLTLKSDRECYVGICLNNIGNVHREKKEYIKAIYYFEKALKEKDLIKRSPGLYGILLNNLACCMLAVKKHNGFPNNLFLAIKLLKNDIDKKEIIVSNIYLSNYYFVKKDTLKAITYSEKALKLAKETKGSYYFLTALSNAGFINSCKASEYIKEYHKKNDSIVFAERLSRNQYYKIQFQTDEILKEKDKAINQKWIISGISAVVILIVVLILIITWQRSKQKELRMHQKQQKSDQEIYHLMFTQKAKEEQVRQTEKKRIALELHDGIMNKLSSTRLNLAVLSHKADKDTIQKCLTYVKDIYKIEQEIRSVSHDLNDEIFRKEDSFIRMLEDFVIEQNKTSKTQYKLEFDQEIDWNNISSELKMHLYRIIQEASQNINKYSQAKNAMINLLLDYPNICMSISDDGIGFDTKATPKGIGIQNMKMRVNLLKGKITINSIRQKSTSINIAIPLNNFWLSSS